MSWVSFFTSSPTLPALTDSDEIDQRFRHKRILGLIAITVCYGLAYTCRLSFAAAKKPLLDAGVFDANELGLIGSALFYTYAFGKLTNGFLADHVNLKRFFSVGVILSASINLAMGRTQLLWIWVLLWGINGWFQGFGAPTAAVFLARWFGNKERGRYYGTFSLGHPTGEALSFVLLPALGVAFGWQASFWGPGLWCIVAAILVYPLVTDRPASVGLPPVRVWCGETTAAASSTPATPLTWREQIRILKIPAIWIVGLASASMYVTRYAINSWGLVYFQEARGFSAGGAGGLLLVNTLSGLVGSFTFGYVSDRYFNARRPPVILIYGMLEIIALAMILFGPPGKTGFLIAGLVIYGFALNGLLTVLGGLFAIDIAPKRAAGAAMGLMGVFSYIGAAIQERVSGYLIQKGTAIVDGVSHVDYHAVALFWFFASVLSLLLSVSLWRVRAEG